MFAIRTCVATQSARSALDRHTTPFRARVIAGFFLTELPNPPIVVPKMKRFSDPEVWWSAVEPLLGDRRLTIALTVLALVGAFVVAVASEIGVRFFNTDWDYTFGYAVQRNRGWQPFVALWIGLTIAPIVQGLVGAALLKIYSRPRRWLRGVAVAIIGSVPMYVAGVTLVLLPGILLFAIAFVISCGWWASGNRRLLGLAYGESPEHVAVSLTISSGLMLLVFASFPL